MIFTFFFLNFPVATYRGKVEKEERKREKVNDSLSIAPSSNPH